MISNLVLRDSCGQEEEVVLKGTQCGGIKIYVYIRKKCNVISRDSWIEFVSRDDALRYSDDSRKPVVDR